MGDFKFRAMQLAAPLAAIGLIAVAAVRTAGYDFDIVGRSAMACVMLLSMVILVWVFSSGFAEEARRRKRDAQAKVAREHNESWPD